jgi:two-component system phosphate regulon sensor histidine kinase PhoR
MPASFEKYFSEFYKVSQKKIYAWLSGICLLLILLIGIQLVWLRNAANMERKETEMHIQRALEKAETRVKKNTYCFSTYSKTLIGAGEGLYFLRQKWNKDLGYIGQPDTIDMYMDLEGYIPDTQIYKMATLEENYPTVAEIHINFAMQIADTGKEIDDIRPHHEDFSGKKFREILANKKPIDSIISMRFTDSMLKLSLAEEHINAQFGFGFITEDNNKVAFARRITDSAALLASPYSSSIFADNKFVRQHRMALVFSEPLHTTSGNYWLYASIGIILVLAFSFYFFVRLYIRQTRLSEMKSDFINNLTHEFNTPMANISLAIETLTEQNHTKDPKIERIFNIISVESGRLRENIERALQVATMEKGDLQLRKEEVDVVATINTIISSYQLQCEQVNGVIKFDHSTSCIIYADETHLLNCICNLIDNAIKYRQGPPKIDIQLEEKDNHIVLTVSDNGKGMNNETQKHIFKKFYRAHEGDTHNTKGFGLGLNYVKGIIDAHGGKISVWSKPGIGTKFTIILPKNTSHGE